MVGNNLSYTILAYGNVIEAPKIPGRAPLYNADQGDGFIPFLHATELFNTLDTDKRSIFELTGINHNQFGDDEDDDYEDSVFPGSTDDMVYEYYYGKEENGQIVIPGLQQLINSHLFGNN